MLGRPVVLALISLALSGTTANAASVNLGVSADPTEEEQLTITATGSTEVNRRLFIYISNFYTACPATAGGTSGFQRLTAYDGEPISAGSFNQTFSYTPSDNGNYLTCAYVSATQGSTPEATNNLTIPVRKPVASVALSISETGPKTLRVATTGSTEVGRRLFVYISNSYTACPATAGGTSGFQRLTAYDGEPISAGSFSKAFDHSFTANGSYLVCAFVAQSMADQPIATASSTATRQGALAVSAPAEVEHNQAVPISISGTTYNAVELQAFVSPAQTGCASTSGGQAGRSGVVPVLGRTRADGVPINASASFGPAAAGTYIVCAYAEGSGTAMTASAQFVIKQDPAIYPILFGQDDERHRDRLIVRWRRGSDKMKDHVLIYDREPGERTPTIWDFDPDADLDRTQAKGEMRTATVKYLGYGQFWWRIRRTDGTTTIYGPVQRARVVPRPLSAATARARASLTLKESSKTPGTARIAIVSSPLSKVKVRISRRGHTIMSRSYTEGVGGRRGITKKLSCNQTGITKFTVTMTDPYGTTLTRRGQWTLSAARCTALRAAEARKRREAARRAAERARARAERERQESQDNSSGNGDSGGSTGCDGDPGATPYPQFPGQRDGDRDGCYGES